MTAGFFAEVEEQSLVKARIVVSYFRQWARIMAPRADRIGYLDFYAGKGRYGDGEKSTPLLILEEAIADASLRDRLVTVFNDANPSFTESLEQEFKSLTDVNRLKFPPQVFTGEVDDSLVDEFESMTTIPSLSFIDPWGYKGLSLRLIQAVIKDWGCEAIFFFNYNRINMGIANPLVDAHMEALFGGRLPIVRAAIDGALPAEREHVLRRELGEALRSKGAEYLIPFRFQRNDGRTSHYICFVTKSPTGYKIMKGVMAEHGIVDNDGVPRFEYFPAAAGRQMSFDEERPILSLPGDLLETFKGRTLTRAEIFDEHNVGTPFLEKHYRQVLLAMEARGEVDCDPPAANRRLWRGLPALPDHVRISFRTGHRSR